ncbi:multicopper oxidase family protein [Albidovulum sediminicola]|uniref:Multicopper oxidase domain-containing protein n=1 Tax=Albidovulum sediminicola TaxID=2984331 RepID=A0ABT2Z607_9RHOB|nr:multicopper oxidase domain-containing protein [Defluviimonas sp. WL0075]MCV2866559.1 multicopper oxidase domain-containing protein [Defluviimonas sp. WL0075]
MPLITRRNFMAGTAAATGLALISAPLPATARAAGGVLSLRATRRTLDIGGRAASVLGLLDAQGRSGLVLDPGQRFRVDLANDLDVETIVHWHGQIPPNAQDGVPNTNPLLAAGASRSFDYDPHPGTYWMHAHVPAQEVDLLAAPLIVRSAEDVAADRQEVVMFLHDLSFRPGEEVLDTISRGMAMDHGTVQQGSQAMSGMSEMPGMGNMGGMNHGAMGAMPGMGGMSMDLNDFEFDAYVANDRTLDDPEVVPVENGGRVLLRVVNASSMTVYWIDTGEIEGRLVAVDGHSVQPLTGRHFGIAMAQRLDIELTLPADGMARPILALREGARERSGIVLAPSGAAVPRLALLSDAEHPAFSGDPTQELALRAANPLSDRAPDRSHMVILSGAMMPYVWTINGQTWGSHTPIAVKTGERVEMMFHNMSMMAHPMHLHGHVFQVVGVNGQRFAGAMRDTVHVPAMGSVTIAFDAGEVAPWMLHCHHMAHMATGMMTELGVQSA